jgi:hypothetical protein
MGLIPYCALLLLVPYQDSARRFPNVMPKVHGLEIVSFVCSHGRPSYGHGSSAAISLLGFEGSTGLFVMRLLRPHGVALGLIPRSKASRSSQVLRCLNE